MDQDLVKTLEDDFVQRKFEQLYGKQPSNEDKYKIWLQKRTIFYIAWDSCRRYMKQKISAEVEEFFREASKDYDMRHIEGRTYMDTSILKELVI